MSKPILCLDFDGVIHSYTSGWKGADIIPDPPVNGAMQFIRNALKHFRVAIFSSRSNQPGGLEAMKDYIAVNSEMGFKDPIEGLEWPLEKPAAFVTIDDRALTFDGVWPDIEKLKNFKPWNKGNLGATGEFPHGKIDEHDEGALKIGIAYNDSAGIVQIEFGKSVAWLGLEPAHAIEFAKAVLRKAGAKKVEVSF